MPDPKVEILEKEIRELRAELSAFVIASGAERRDLKNGIEKINGHIVDMLMEIGGVPDHLYRDPDRPSLRSRVHNLENDRNAEKIARALKGTLWTRSQKLSLFAFAAIGAVGVIARFFVGG